MKNLIFGVIGVCALLFSSCGYDNYDEPESILSGTIQYDGAAVGVCTDGTGITLWQDGYDDYEAIDVNIAQDGTYSARLFDGTYKLVLENGTPWQDLSGDTLEITVKGNTVQDLDVTPYFTFSNVNITKASGTAVTFTFTVNQVDESADLSKVRVFLNSSKLVDTNYRDSYESIYTTDGLEIGVSYTYTLDIPEDLQSEDYIFARIGVLTDGQSEYYYSEVEQIDL